MDTLTTKLSIYVVAELLTNIPNWPSLRNLHLLTPQIFNMGSSSESPNDGMSASPNQSLRVKPVIPLSRRRRPWVSRGVSHFQQIEQVGEGTYGYALVLSFVLLIYLASLQTPLSNLRSRFRVSDLFVYLCLCVPMSSVPCAVAAKPLPSRFILQFTASFCHFCQRCSSNATLSPTSTCLAYPVISIQ